jgi:FKBP-type peptidyl-prolyl cis-trans isomerase
MFDGKEKRLALIDELLIVASTEKINEEEEQQLIQYKQSQMEENALKKGIIGKFFGNGIIKNNQSKLKANEINGMVEFMENAENERKMRENRETGTRQAEQILKKREEKLYREVMQVHQNTVGKGKKAFNNRLVIANHL